MSNKTKRNIHPDFVNHKYSGEQYVKPRYMKPRNMTKESSEEFVKGHIQQNKHKKKK